MNELKLRDDVLDVLAYEPIVDPAHIGVAVDQGVVTLTGHVGSYAQKLAALSAVRRVNGVHGIADEIEVRYPSIEKMSDDEIANARSMWCCGTASFPVMQSRSRCGTGSKKQRRARYSRRLSGARSVRQQYRNSAAREA
jgi:hypothetical protein